MRSTLCALAFAAVVATAPVASAGTIHVPGDYASIQAAINASVNGDLIVIAAGTYFENLDTKGKAITLLGAGMEKTYVDGKQMGSCIKIVSGESAATIVDSIGFKHGSGTPVGPSTFGGAMYIANASSPTVRNSAFGFSIASTGAGIFVESSCHPNFVHDLVSNNFTKNKGQGGGMYVAGDSTIDATRVAENGAPNGSGGGVYFANTNSTFTNGTVSQNFAYYGGGIQVKAGSPTITGNWIERNSVLTAPSNGEGAGIGILGKSTAYIANNLITQNSAHNGGGLYAYDSEPIVSFNVVHDNVADQGLGFGGGISFGKVGPKGSLDRNEIYQNVAGQGGGVALRTGTSALVYCNIIDLNVAHGGTGRGGGIFSAQSNSPSLANTIVYNDAVDGGGLYVQGATAPLIDTSIIYFNTATSNSSFFDGSGVLILTYADVETNVVGAGDISVDPLFVNAGGRNYSLQSTSLLINAGNSTLNPGGTDIYGNTRVNGPIIDMGAVEF